MDKQLNARVKPELHNQIKQLSSDSKIIMNTLVETLLEIGLKHYQDGNIGIDSDRYITKDDLITFESGLLKKVESLIANSASGQAKSIDSSSVNPSPVNNISKDSDRYNFEQLNKMGRDQIRTIYKGLVPSSERPKGSPIHVDTLIKAKMIEIILERSPQ
jgi:hypothetical protein